MNCTLTPNGLTKAPGLHGFDCGLCGRPYWSVYQSPEMCKRPCVEVALPHAHTSTPVRPGWGDRLQRAFAKVGVTDESVSAWIGAPCKCPERREKLNRLGRWVNSILTGSQSEADAAAAELTSEIGRLS